MVNALNPVEEIVYKIFSDLDAKRNKSLYASLRDAARMMKIPDDKDLPEQAYQAAAAFLMFEAGKICEEGHDLVEKLFSAVEKSGDAQLKELVEEAKAPHLFFAAMAKQALKTLDYDDLAAYVIEKGAERAKAATSSTATKAS